MASSRMPGPLGGHPGFLWHTPGPLGYNDAGDPDVDRIHTTDTAGPLGHNDWAAPDHPAYRARNRLMALNWSGKTSKPPTGEEMKNNPSVRSYLLTMLKASCDAEGTAEGEHGGWIYSSPEFPQNFCFRLTSLRYRRAVNLDDPPDLSHLGLWVVGTFHTHPHRDEPGRPSRPGDKGIGGGGNVEADTEAQQRYGVPGLVIDYSEEIYVYGPTSRLLDWGGGRGFPGRAFR